MEIQKMVSEDYDAVYQLWMSCKGMGLNNLDDSREGIDRFLQRNPETCFAAWEEGQLVGAILVGSDGRRGYIYHTAVAPSFRRRGIAKALVECALGGLKKLGIHKVALVVFDRNAEGNGFWEKMGFAVRTDLVYRNRVLDEMIRYDT